MILHNAKHLLTGCNTQKLCLHIRKAVNFRNEEGEPAVIRTPGRFFHKDVKVLVAEIREFLQDELDKNDFIIRDLGTPESYV